MSFRFRFDIAIVAFLAFASLSIAGLLLLFLPSSPEIIVFSQWRLSQAKSVAFDVQARYEGEMVQAGQGRQAEGFSYRGEGAVQYGRNDSRARQDFELRVGTGSDAVETDGQIISRDSETFIELKNSPERLGPFSLAALRGGWLRLDVQRLREAYDLPFVGGGRQLDPEDQAKVYDHLRRTPFLRFVRRLPAQTVSGAVCYHYEILPEVIFFKDFAIQYETIRLGRELTNAERLRLDEMFANVTAQGGEMWVGRKDYYPRRLLLRFGYDSGQKKGVFSLALNLANFNQPVEVAAPGGNIRDISSLVESLLPGLIAHLPMAGDAAFKRPTPPSGSPAGAQGTGGDKVTGGTPTEQGPDRDRDGLPDFMEAFYMTDANNPDTDGDGASDGLEVERATNPNGTGGLYDFGIFGSL